MEDPNIGRVITSRELATGDEFYEHPGTGARLFPFYATDGSINGNPCLVMKIDGKLRTYAVEQGGIRPTETFTILKQIGSDYDGDKRWDK